MSKLRAADKVIFFHSILYNTKKVSFGDLQNLIKDNFGEHLIFTHPYFPMKNYYSNEMGAQDDLERFFVFYPKLENRENLIAAKLLSTKLEDESLDNDNRIYNLDIGFISKDQVVLATGKPYSHRMYLGEGVYGELTYRFCGKSYEKLDWTYPDYSHPEVIHKFNWIRQFHFLDKLLD